MSLVKHGFTALFLIGLLAACTRETPTSSEDIRTAIGLAERFGQAVVTNDFQSAHALLTNEAQQAHSPAALKADVARMIAYAKEPLNRAVVVEEVIMTDWPDKKPGDLVWVYVSLEGVSYSEGVSIVLGDTDLGIRIREIEWGRP